MSLIPKRLPPPRRERTDDPAAYDDVFEALERRRDYYEGAKKSGKETYYDQTHADTLEAVLILREVVEVQARTIERLRTVVRNALTGKE